MTRALLLLPLLVPGVALRLAGQQDAPTSTTYHLTADSRLEVKTGKAGLLGFAGHEHLIRANAFEGVVVYRPDSLAATTISIRIYTDGLAVLTPPDTAEIRKVTASMREEVLHVAQYPEITFVSDQVVPGAKAHLVTAAITMHGTTRDVTVPVTVEFRGDTLVARSRFELKQTDFGIRPFRGGPAGAVRVADKVSFNIEARALPE